MKEAVVAIEDQRFYEHRGVDFQGIARAVCPGRRSPARPAGRLDDHPAVRQERARGAGQPNGLPEAPRGGARLPPRAPVVQGQDPHRVPELDLLRRGRLRDRGRRATYFGCNHPGCGERRGRDRRAPPSCCPRRRRCSPGSSPRPTPTRRAANPESADRAPQPRARRRCVEQGYITQEEYDAVSPRSRSRPRRRSSRRRRTRGALLHLLAAPAARRPLRRRRGVRRRPADPVDPRPRPPGRGRGDRRQHARRDRADRLGRRARQRRPAASWRWSAATTTRRRRSTSPPTASASRLVVQAVHPDHRARAGPLDQRGLRLGAAGDPVQGQGRRRRTATTKIVNELFDVNNYEDNYLGSASLATATTYSDNSVYAQLGIQVGPENIAATADEDGDRDRPLDRHRVLDRRRPLRALQPGADPRRPRDRRHAARDGARLQHARGRRRADHRHAGRAARAARSGSIEVTDGEDADEGDARSTDQTGASGENKIDRQAGDRRPRSPTTAKRHARDRGHAPAPASNAQTGEPTWGKTGTTDNNGDAWFCGATERHHRLRLGRPRRHGRRRWRPSTAARPVDGGTFPALIFADVVNAYEALQDARKASEDARPTTTTPTAPDDRRRARRPRRPAAPDGAGARRGGRAAPSERRRRRAGGPAAAAAAERRRHRRRLSAPAAVERRLARPAGRERKRLPAAQKRQGSSTAFVIPIRGPGDDLRLRAAGSRARSSNGGSVERRAVQLEPDAERLGQLARARAELAQLVAARGARASVDAPARLERADQDRRGARPRARRRRSAGCGSRRRGRRRRARAGRRASRSAGSARRRRGRRVVALVALGLDDHAADAVEAQLAADQVAGDVVHRALEERRVEREPRLDPRERRELGERARARPSSCSATRSEAVPPAETFDSSHAPLGAAPRSTRRRAARSGRRAPRGRAPRARRPRSSAVADEAADDAVGLAERHPLADQQVGDVGRGEQLVARPPRRAARGRSAARRASARAASRQSSSVSTASNSASLSSCRSLE